MAQSSPCGRGIQGLLLSSSTRRFTSLIFCTVSQPRSKKPLSPRLFTVGSDDGYFLSVAGYSQGTAPTGAISVHTSTYNGVRSFAYGDSANGTSACRAIRKAA